MLAVGGSGAVYVIAGVDYAVDDGQTGGICGAGAGVLEILGFAGAQLLEHVVCHGHLAGRVADAGADTAKVAAAHLVDDGAQAVVTGMASAHLNTHVAGGNIELVVDDEQLLGLDLVLAAELEMGPPEVFMYDCGLTSTIWRLPFSSSASLMLMSATSAPAWFFQYVTPA